MQHGFSLDPREILGVGGEASLQEIRDSYRDKAKRYHPDHGGDEWIFRVVCRAYEILSTARVAGRVSTDGPGYAPPPPSAASRPHVDPMKPPTAADTAKRAERTKVGIHDTASDPARIVDVELFVVRYAITDPMQALLSSADERTLSCTLNLAWPGRGFVQVVNPAAEDAILPMVTRAFEPLARKTRAIDSRGRVEDSRFAGWLSYPSHAKATEALQVLHRAFLDAGLGIYQWTREMTVPRDDS